MGFAVDIEVTACGDSRQQVLEDNRLRPEHGMRSEDDYFVYDDD